MKKTGYRQDRSYDPRSKSRESSSKTNKFVNLFVFAVIIVALCIITIGALYVVRYSPSDVFMKLRDRQPPLIRVHDAVALNGETYDIEDFLDSVSDMTKVELSYVKAPDFDSDGIQDVIIMAVDEAGNYTEASLKLKVLHDTTPPVIEGTDEYTAYMGETISYKELVNVSDDSGEECTLDIDNSGVDLFYPGYYDVLYTATDPYGNSQTKTVTIHVVESYSPEYYRLKADEICDIIIDQIIYPEMDDLHKVWAVYEYVRNIPYILTDYTRDYVVEGYKMLNEYRGDCYGSYAAVRLLLERLGIPNIPVVTDERWTTHFWNMVSVDGGVTWYHVDATNWTEWYLRPNMCMISDVRLQQISTDHNGTHIYIQEDYPSTPYYSMEVPADIDAIYNVNEEERQYESWYWGW